jgi:polyisoprenyl-teichoic acid--peptidoglycan teichoic acid transferase
MSGIGTSWNELASRNRTVAVAGTVLAALVIAAIVGVTLIGRTASSTPLAAVAPPSSTPTVAPSPTATSIPTATPSTAASASPTPTADPLLGTDGRLTVLLLGSDYRPAHPGNRTDAIMVVSIDPTTGKSAAFSVPRDITDFPMPTAGTYGAKVTGLYQHLASTTGDGPAAMKQAVGRAFGLEIDRYVLIGFSGVTRLVAAVGGVDVTLAAPYYDPYYWVNGHHQGWGLPAGKSHLNAADALIFARSRKGDSDFSRAKRQQQLVMAAIDKVRKRGIADLPTLISIARDTVRTDLPLARMTDLFDLFSTVDLGSAKHVVFGPKQFAVRAGGTDYRLVLAACDKWIAANFPPARPMGSWPAS